MIFLYGLFVQILRNIQVIRQMVSSALLGYSLQMPYFWQSLHQSLSFRRRVDCFVRSKREQLIGVNFFY